MRLLLLLLLLPIFGFADDGVTERAKKIKYIVCEVEGVLFGQIVISPYDIEPRLAINIKDQSAIRQAKDNDLYIILMSENTSQALANWAADQGVRALYQGVQEKDSFMRKEGDLKKEALENIARRQMASLSEIAYIGDDIEDVEALKICGLSCCPQDALPRVKEVCGYVSQAKSGEGVLYDVVDLILSAQSLR